MASTEPLTIDTLEKAGRFLGNIGREEGFDEALKRVESRSSAEIRSRLNELGAWVRGTESREPDPRLEFIGTVVRHAPGALHINQAIADADDALADARSLADHVRSGVLSGTLYLGLLLAVGAYVALIWVTSIAAAFDGLYQSMSAPMPALSQFFTAYPWLIFLILAGVALLLGLFVTGMRNLSARVEVIGPLNSGWKAWVVSRSLRRAHANWRALTLARAWVAAGARPAEALHQALGVLGVDSAQAAGLEAGVDLAAELGAGAGELDYLAIASVSQLRDAIETWQAIASRGLQLLVALVVGLIIVAIYLPIFGLGAIV